MAKKPKPLADDADFLALAESQVGALGETFKRSDLEALKEVVASYSASAGDGASEVVGSLIGLLNDLMASGQVDREALTVHVRAWRYMAVRKPSAAERIPLLEGLARVRRLYMPAASAA